MKKQMAVDRVNDKAADVIKTIFIYSRFKRASQDKRMESSSTNLMGLYDIGNGSDISINN
jgi:hypothetical protein